MAGKIIYQGPSMLDGAPIVAIAITSSSNRKTGDMVQTHILRADVAPIAAIRTGADASICGDCPHRGRATGTKAEGRTCYVNVAQGPTVVFKSYVAGKYPVADDVAAIGEGRMVRLGTYGDPAAVPVAVWEALVSRAKGRTGYTHQWRKVPALRSLCMASADSAEDASEARAAGWRFFHVTANGAPPTEGAILCPASEEAGKRATCITCGLCKGAHPTAKSVYIPAHGTGKAILSRRVIAIASATL